MTRLEIKAPKETDFSDLKAVTQEEWFQQVFGKAVFISRTKPQMTVKQDNWKGTVIHQRRNYYVIAKPGRQQGDEPKVERKYRLPADLVKGIEERANSDRCNQVDVVEAALRAYLSQSHQLGKLGSQQPAV
ncbi:MAG TPA: hypothetical protein V6D06_14630 [Trichocoleus sp.]